MSGFDLNNYETVKERKKRFYADHPDGRIYVTAQKADEKCALFRAEIYKTREDHITNTPTATGYAYEERDTELQKNKYGKEYESVNYSSWVENCEESAVGRALDNAGYASNNKCSQEEMKKVVRKTSGTTSQNRLLIDSRQLAPHQKPEATSDQGVSEYRVPFGKKYRGKRLSEIDPFDLDSYIQWIKNDANDKGKEITGVVAEFIDKANAYLNSPTIPNMAPGIDENESINP